MSLFDHLEELRGCIVKSVIALVLACLLCIWPARYLLMILARPMVMVLRKYEQPETLLMTGPAEALLIYAKVVIFSGLVLAAPYILYQFWVFIAAGLYPHERKWFHWFVPLSGLLFFAGAAFMYCLVLILSLNFLVGFASWIPRPDAQPNALEKLLLGGSRATTATQPSARNGSDQSTQPAVRMLPVDPTDVPIGTLWFNTADGKLKLSTDSGIVAASLTHEANRALVAPHLRLGEYLNFVLVMTLAFGLAFQTPLVVYALARTGIVTATAFRRYRRVVWFIIVVIAGIVAPPDLLSHLLLSIPMIVLFELGLRLADRATPPRSSGEDVPSDERGGLSTTRP